MHLSHHPLDSSLFPLVVYGVRREAAGGRRRKGRGGGKKKARKKKRGKSRGGGDAGFMQQVSHKQHTHTHTHSSLTLTHTASTLRSCRHVPRTTPTCPGPMTGVKAKVQSKKKKRKKGGSPRLSGMTKIKALKKNKQHTKKAVFPKLQ